ncbi:transcriptional regulator with PAS, ATPase and Fis domain [Bacillus niacini]|uniref:Transcriptional regulator with PAS, ATPase and Fis domain n=1 Tax=Neobacillus niacini TaxID=86668 RepID=A0A852TLC0_9BACI|nr:transcriptional regulator with PAS, ATPase and Fis domain [Neobacillus niacini]
MSGTRISQSNLSSSLFVIVYLNRWENAPKLSLKITQNNFALIKTFFNCQGKTIFYINKMTQIESMDIQDVINKNLLDILDDQSSTLVQALQGV